MKKILYSFFAITCALTGYASELGDTTVLSLNDIIAIETQSKADYDNLNHQRNIWSHDTYLNISLNKTKFSSDEFPTTTGMFTNEYNNNIGVGLQWGHTYGFHKKPIGSVLFIGLDFTWMDLNYNKYKKDSIPSRYSEGERAKNLPWHNEKMTLGYGMSIGPSFTFYPFTPLKSKEANKIRIHLYFHLGYGAEGALIKGGNKDKSISDEWAWAHGLHTAFGGSLSWDHIGVGYEFRNDNSLKFKAVDSEFDTNTMKAKEKTGRFYLQFRFRSEEHTV